MKQFVHLGDLHLGTGQNNLDALDEAIREVEGMPNLAGWMWPGDIFHAKSTIESRNALIPRVVDMASVAPVVICYGNHDAPGDLDFLAALDAKHAIHVVSRPKVVHLWGSNAHVFVLPYPTKGALLAMGADVKATAAQCLDAICLDGAQQLEKLGGASMVIGHLNIAGSISSTGQPQIGKEIEMSRETLARFKDMPVVLNHIHKAQTIGAGDAFYAGSLCRLNWGEVEEKRFLITGFDDGRATGGSSWSGYQGDGPTACCGDHDWDILSRPLISSPPMYHVEHPRSGAWHVKRGPEGEYLEPPDSWAGNRVRVRYEFSPEDDKQAVEAYLRSEFRDALELKLEPVVQPAGVVRAPEVAEATSLNDKVAAWCKLQGVEFTMGVGEKLAAMTTTGRDELLSILESK